MKTKTIKTYTMYVYSIFQLTQYYININQPTAAPYIVVGVGSRLWAARYVVLFLKAVKDFSLLSNGQTGFKVHPVNGSRVLSQC
jgi:hypothetical protein